MSGKDSSDLDPVKATQMLKEILHLGKPAVSDVSHDLNRSSTVNGKSDTNRIRMESEDHDNDPSVTGNVVPQEIRLTGSDDANTFPIYGTTIVVKCSTDNHVSGSSKVKIKDIVNSGWENRYHSGQQVVVSPSGDYVAYAIMIPQHIDGVIRIVNWKTKQRELLRGMKGLVVDLAFSNCTDDVLLASVDEFGSLFVHSIKCRNGEHPNAELVLTVLRPEATTASTDRRVIWCLYIPNDVTPDDDVDLVNEFDNSKRLVVTHSNVADVLNVDAVVKEYGAGPLYTDHIQFGYLQINAHKLPISGVALSPDGTAMATIGYDGVIKFFQIYFPDRKSQRCIHEWIPHNGKPLSCLFFLDNCSNTLPDAKFWKFAITGAAYNREIKIWNCASWICLQTIRFEVPEGAILPELKAGIDSTAEYLILSDIARRVLYVLNIYQDPEKNVAQVSCITEFLLTSPMLSFTILSITRKKLKPLSDEDQLDEGNFDSLGAEVEDEWKDKSSREEGVILRLLYVQPASLQECRIAYQPALSISNLLESISSFSMDSVSYKDRLSDLSYDTSTDVACGRDTFSQLSMSLASLAVGNAGGPLLLTPDVFSSPKNDIASNDTLSATLSASKVSSASEIPSGTNLMNLDTPRESPHQKLISSGEATSSGHYSAIDSLALSRSLNDGNDKPSTPYGNGAHETRAEHSTGSSPSLEVQEILYKDLDDKDIEFIDQDQQDEVVASTSVGASSSGIDKDRNNLITLTNMSPANQVVVVKAKSLSPRPTYSEGVFGNDLVKWPTAPKVPAGYTLQGKEHASVKPGAASNSGSLWAPKDNALQGLTAAHYEHLIRSNLALTEAVEGQKLELQCMRQAIVNLNARMEVAAMSETLQSDMNSSIKTLLQKHRQAETSAIGNMLKSHEEKLISAVVQTVNNTVVCRMESAIKAEVKNNVVPAVSRELDTLTKTVNAKITKKVAATDALLKENATKFAELKADVSSIMPLISSSVHGSLHNVFQDAFQNVLLPAFDKSCQTMFLQINDAFQKGTKEYTQQLNAAVEKQQTGMTEQMQAVLEQIQLNASVGDELDKQLHTTLMKFEEGLSNRFSTLVQKEMSVAIREHQAVIGSTVVNAIKSRAVTPVPMVDRSVQQAAILQHLQHGQLNSAFQQALSASDLPLVMFVCQKVNPSQVFGESPCPLQQPVILSLIHQLSADLNTNTELKQEFLQEALVNLNLDDPGTNSHVPMVFDNLQQKLRHFIQSKPGSKMLRSVKMLLMATESVLQRHARKLPDGAVYSAVDL